jgi:hypothetical protein
MDVQVLPRSVDWMSGMVNGRPTILLREQVGCPSVPQGELIGHPGSHR